MSFSQIPGRIAYELADFPHLFPSDLTECQTPRVSVAINQYMGMSDVAHLGPNIMHKTWGLVGHPEEDALLFYMLNHAFSLVRQRRHPLEALSEHELAVVQQYKAHMAIMVPRMFYYLLLICTRESRHDGQSKTAAPYLKLEKDYGDSIIAFHKSLAGKGSDGAAEALRKHPPNATLGKYTSFLSDVFYGGKYSSGFGGPAWGKIADVARDFVHGKLSAEMMLDTAYTLAHNNGPIFNKGMLFKPYSNQIYKILDVQRAGMIPQLVGSEDLSSDARTPRVMAAFNMCSKALPDEFSGHVDWEQVEKLGAVKTYPNEIAKQKGKANVAPANKIKKTVFSSIDQFDPDELDNHFDTGEVVIQQHKVFVYPGQFILKVKR